MMKLHKEGAGTLLSGLMIFFGVDACLWYTAPHCVFYGSVVITSIVYAILLWFFRKPVRVASQDVHNIIAPCDGKIVVIEDVVENEFFKDKRKQVSIFMSPLNVHINWYPVSGSVEYYKYHPGEKLVAWHPKSSELNERSTIVVKTPGNKQVLFRQIAGALARRIVCYAQQGTSVEQGQEVGFIKFGSRMDLFLPLDARINVTIDQKVEGNKTVIATW